MRTFYIFLLIIISNTIAFAQYREPYPWLFKYDDNPNDRALDPALFNQSSILTGFQWSSSLEMNNALSNNCFGGHGLPDLPTGSSRTLPLNMINQPTWLD
jgi:hypothetical protein